MNNGINKSRSAEVIARSNAVNSRKSSMQYNMSDVTAVYHALFRQREKMAREEKRQQRAAKKAARKNQVTQTAIDNASEAIGDAIQETQNPLESASNTVSMFQQNVEIAARILQDRQEKQADNAAALFEGLNPASDRGKEKVYLPAFTKQEANYTPNQLAIQNKILNSNTGDIFDFYDKIATASPEEIIIDSSKSSKQSIYELGNNIGIVDRTESYTVFDLETTARLKDSETGVISKPRILEYSFLNVDGDKREVISSAIGLKSDEVEDFRKLSDRYFRGEKLDNDDVVTLKRFALAGSDKTIVDTDYSKINPGLVRFKSFAGEEDLTEGVTEDLVKKGIDLYESIGKYQFEEVGENAEFNGVKMPAVIERLYRQADRAKNTVHVGHNINYFDVPVMQNAFQNGIASAYNIDGAMSFAPKTVDTMSLVAQLQTTNDGVDKLGFVDSLLKRRVLKDGKENYEERLKELRGSVYSKLKDKDLNINTQEALTIILGLDNSDGTAHQAEFDTLINEKIFEKLSLDFRIKDRITGKIANDIEADNPVLYSWRNFTYNNNDFITATVDSTDKSIRTNFGVKFNQDGSSQKEFFGQSGIKKGMFYQTKMTKVDMEHPAAKDYLKANPNIDPNNLSALHLKPFLSDDKLAENMAHSDIIIIGTRDKIQESLQSNMLYAGKGKKMPGGKNTIIADKHTDKKLFDKMHHAYSQGDAYEILGELNNPKLQDYLYSNKQFDIDALDDVVKSFNKDVYDKIQFPDMSYEEFCQSRADEFLARTRAKLSKIGLEDHKELNNLINNMTDVMFDIRKGRFADEENPVSYLYNFYESVNIIEEQQQQGMLDQALVDSTSRLSDSAQRKVREHNVKSDLKILGLLDDIKKNNPLEVNEYGCLKTATLEKNLELATAQTKAYLQNNGGDIGQTLIPRLGYVDLATQQPKLFSETLSSQVQRTKYMNQIQGLAKEAYKQAVDKAGLELKNFNQYSKAEQEVIQNYYADTMKAFEYVASEGGKNMGAIGGVSVPTDTGVFKDMQTIELNGFRGIKKNHTLAKSNTKISIDPNNPVAAANRIVRAVQNAPGNIKENYSKNSAVGLLKDFQEFHLRRLQTAFTSSVADEGVVNHRKLSMEYDDIQKELDYLDAKFTNFYANAKPEELTIITGNERLDRYNADIKHWNNILESKDFTDRVPWIDLSKEEDALDDLNRKLTYLTSNNADKNSIEAVKTEIKGLEQKIFDSRKDAIIKARDIATANANRLKLKIVDEDPLADKTLKAIYDRMDELGTKQLNISKTIGSTKNGQIQYNKEAQKLKKDLFENEEFQISRDDTYEVAAHKLSKMFKTHKYYAENVENNENIRDKRLFAKAFGSPYDRDMINLDADIKPNFGLSAEQIKNIAANKDTEYVALPTKVKDRKRILAAESKSFVRNSILNNKINTKFISQGEMDVLSDPNSTFEDFKYVMSNIHAKNVTLGTYNLSDLTTISHASHNTMTQVDEFMSNLLGELSKQNVKFSLDEKLGTLNIVDGEKRQSIKLPEISFENGMPTVAVGDTQALYSNRVGLYNTGYLEGGEFKLSATTKAGAAFSKKSSSKYLAAVIDNGKKRGDIYGAINSVIKNINSEIRDDGIFIRDMKNIDLEQARKLDINDVTLGLHKLKDTSFYKNLEYDPRVDPDKLSLAEQNNKILKELIDKSFDEGVGTAFRDLQAPEKQAVIGAFNDIVANFEEADGLSGGVKHIANNTKMINKSTSKGYVEILSPVGALQGSSVRKRHVTSMLHAAPTFSTDAAQEVIDSGRLSNGRVGGPLKTRTETAAAENIAEKIGHNIDNTISADVLEIRPQDYQALIAEASGKGYFDEADDKIVKMIQSTSTYDGSGVISPALADAGLGSRPFTKRIDLQKIDPDDEKTMRNLDSLGAMPDINIKDGKIDVKYNEGTYHSLDDLKIYTKSQNSVAKEQVKYGGVSNIRFTYGEHVVDEQKINEILSRKENAERIKNLEDLQAQRTEVFKILKEEKIKATLILEDIEASTHIKLQNRTEKVMGRVLGAVMGQYDENIANVMDELGMGKFKGTFINHDFLKDIDKIDTQADIASRNKFVALTGLNKKSEVEKMLSDPKILSGKKIESYDELVREKILGTLRKHGFNSAAEFKEAVYKERDLPFTELKNAFDKLGVKFNDAQGIMYSAPGMKKHGELIEGVNLVMSGLESLGYNEEDRARAAEKLFMQREGSIASKNKSLLIDENANINVDELKRMYHDVIVPGEKVAYDEQGQLYKTGEVKRLINKVDLKDGSSVEYATIYSNLNPAQNNDVVKPNATYDVTARSFDNLFTSRQKVEEVRNSAHQMFGASLGDKILERLGIDNYENIGTGEAFRKQAYANAGVDKDFKGNIIYSKLASHQTGLEESRSRGMQKLAAAGITEDMVQKYIDNDPFGADFFTDQRIIDLHAGVSSIHAHQFNTDKQSILYNNVDKMKEIGFNGVFNLNDVDVSVDTHYMENSIHGNAMIVDLHDNKLGNLLYGDKSENNNRFIAIPYLDKNTIDKTGSEASQTKVTKAFTSLQNTMSKLRESEGLTPQEHERLEMRAIDQTNELIETVSNVATSNDGAGHYASILHVPDGRRRTANAAGLFRKGELKEAHNFLNQFEFEGAKVGDIFKHSFDSNLSGTKDAATFDFVIESANKKRSLIASESNKLAALLGEKKLSDNLVQSLDDIVTREGVTGQRVRHPETKPGSNYATQIYYSDTVSDNTYVTNESVFAAISGDFDSDQPGGTTFTARVAVTDANNNTRVDHLSSASYKALIGEQQARNRALSDAQQALNDAKASGEASSDMLRELEEQVSFHKSQQFTIDRSADEDFKKQKIDIIASANFGKKEDTAHSTSDPLSSYFEEVPGATDEPIRYSERGYSADQQKAYKASYDRLKSDYIKGLSAEDNKSFNALSDSEQVSKISRHLRDNTEDGALSRVQEETLKFAALQTRRGEQIGAALGKDQVGIYNYHTHTMNKIFSSTKGALTQEETEALALMTPLFEESSITSKHNTGGIDPNDAKRFSALHHDIYSEMAGKRYMSDSRIKENEAYVKEKMLSRDTKELARFSDAWGSTAEEKATNASRFYVSLGRRVSIDDRTFDSIHAYNRRTSAILSLMDQPNLRPTDSLNVLADRLGGEGTIAKSPGVKVLAANEVYKGKYKSQAIKETDVSLANLTRKSYALNNAEGRGVFTHLVSNISKGGSGGMGMLGAAVGGLIVAGYANSFKHHPDDATTQANSAKDAEIVANPENDVVLSDVNAAAANPDYIMPQQTQQQTYNIQISAKSAHSSMYQQNKMRNALNSTQIPMSSSNVTINQSSENPFSRHEIGKMIHSNLGMYQ